ncbi:hypothetical protein ABK249_01470 [Neorhizobium sp. Rsf11]|uniref:Protein NO VEIN C-terminal domain-containing protein n=1 Tax=Neorhizobium phenanthreniclasticum TaxID=3157917 RepID=A0ABV0LVG1_9HYPH
MAYAEASVETLDLIPPTASAADAIGAATRSQLEHVIDAHRRGLRVYESLKSLNDVIGAQYGDRVLFELLQNAHDAHDPEEDGQIAIRLIVEGPESGTLLVANKGRAFTASNLEAIRNIGTSDKEIGEGIGNKGLGFRSVEALTDSVHIYSSGPSGDTSCFDGYCFRFATVAEIAAKLRELGATMEVAGKLATSVPRYLVPITVDDQSDEVRRLCKEGYVTVVALPLGSKEAIELARKQVTKVLESSAPVLLFLDRLVVLDAAVITPGTLIERKCLTRNVETVEAPLPPNYRMERVTLDGCKDFLVVRQTLPKAAVLDAVRASMTAAPPLKRWLNWKGDAVVSIAVPLAAPMLDAPRLFNFLPMDDHSISPMAGHIDAPFFADIDRRSIKSDLPLNKHLLEAAARTAALAALTIVESDIDVPASSVIDLAAWSGGHMHKIVEAFAALKRPLSEAAIWPIVDGGPLRWANFNDLYAWPDVRTNQVTPRKLASTAAASILLNSIGEGRRARVHALASAVSLPLRLTEDILRCWVQAIIKQIGGKGSQAARRWRNFYDDVALLYSTANIPLSSLEGEELFPDSNGKLLIATAEGMQGAPPVFHRIGRERGKRNAGPPSPPSSLARKFRFLGPSIEISESSLLSFERAGLLRRYDPIETLNSLKSASGSSATDIQRRETLIWAYRVWQNLGGKAVEIALRAANLSVPCLAGWCAASEALLSASWTTVGRTLEGFLHEAAPHSADVNDQKGKLIVSFADWPRASDDRREDWLRFLAVLGVRDGLQPIAGRVRREGTPSNYWNNFLRSVQTRLGLGAHWISHARKLNFGYPQTEYRLNGEVWRLPGQIEHDKLPLPAREALSDLIVGYLRDNGDAHFNFSIMHWRGFEKIELPTPLLIFLQEGQWPMSLLRDEMAFDTPRQSWSTSALRQIPPRFVPRFWAEPGSRSSIPQVLFDERIALRDWSAPQSAPARLASLAVALPDLSAAERRDLRDQLRRAWNDIAEHRLNLPPDLELVVERSGGLDLLLGNTSAPPVIHVTTEREGFAARALADRGEPVLDIGQIDGKTIRDLLAATGGFDPRPADSGDVQLLVDGEVFQPDPSDPHLVSGSLSWLSDVAILAHEYLGDALELRTLPADEIDRRIRQIRLRRCGHFSLIIDDLEVAAQGGDRIQAVPHPRTPTLLVSRQGEINLDLLLDAAPAITKLLGSRRNTLEPVLGRLLREGYSDASTSPSEDMLARAIRRDISVVRDHFAAARCGVERQVRTILPIIAILQGTAAAQRLSERHERQGPTFKLRDWLVQALGADVADRALSAIEDTEDQAVIRRRMGFDFKEYGQALAALGYLPLNSEADFRRLFAVFMVELRPALVDRVRRRFTAYWREGRKLHEYVALRTLDFIQFDSAWPMENETIDREFVEAFAISCADDRLGPDDISIALPDLEAVVSANRRIIVSNFARLASVIRAWCRKEGRDRPLLMNTGDPQPLVRALHDRGLTDFEIINVKSLPSLFQTVEAWPIDMPESDDIGELGLTESDLNHEEREARDARRQAEVAKRTIEFSGTKLDASGEDFAAVFERLADAALAKDTGWFNRSRPPRLAIQQQLTSERRGAGTGGGGGTDWRNQPPESVRKAMGIASEWLAREYLRRRHPREMTDECWVSSNRAAFCTGGEGNDSLGFDFRVETARHEYLYEVKSALDQGGEFELSARELEIAGSASLERKRRYRILYVPFVFEPSRWRVLPLSNPASPETRNRFRVVRSGSVRYCFET